MGQSLLSSLTDGVNGLLSYANEGFPSCLVSLWARASDSPSRSKCSIIVFFASLIAVLYHVGIMKWIIRIVGEPFNASSARPRPSPECHGQHFCRANRGPLVVKLYIAP